MKILQEAQKIDGVKICRSEVEVVCSNCQDPVSEQEQASGTCTNCGQAWQPKQSVSVWATSVPKAGAKTWGQI
jgi:Zn finger protein HypA/HybF involved in hydrogenase expression